MSRITTLVSLFSRTIGRRTWTMGLLLVVLCGLASPATGQLPIASSTQFDITGFLQEAVLTTPGDPHSGGTLKVNGHTIIVPRETIVIFPANALTWQEIFAQAPSPYTGVATGMAMADIPTPLSTYEVHVVGNRVLNGPAGPDLYIAGLIDIAQQGLNSGQGFINFIDYTTGEMRVGGTINPDGSLNGTNPGTRVRINDPVGRYGRVNSPDVRFTVDPDNPTITAGSGFPMCLPRSTPPPLGGPETDALCPQGNRPVSALGPPVVYFGAVTTNAPVAAPGVTPFPSPFFQAPFEVGDYVTYAGTLVKDGSQPTVGPNPGTANTYISAHTIEANVAIFTAPGTDPAYVRTDVTLIGTGGLTVLGAGEAVVRTRFEGMTTDPSRNIHLYGIDLDPLTGNTSDRDWGTIGVDPGPPNGAVKGRWRFRPPCTAAVATDKACTPPPGGVFIPPTREMRAIIEGQQATQVPPAPTNPNARLAANGIYYGQYHAPILEYIFPENIPGTPIVENNFDTIDFLAKGGYTSSAGTLVGQLSPWPSSIVPTPACTPASASAGGPYTVASGGSITLAGSASGTGPFTLSWTLPAVGSLSSTTVANPLYSAPVVAVQTVVNLTFSVIGACGSGSSNTTVTINAPTAPTVNPVLPMSVFSGNVGSFNVSASDASGTNVTFTVTQAGAPALSNLTVTSTGTTTAQVSFTAPTLPQTQATSTSVTLTITATNATGGVSAPVTTTVTIKPLLDVVTIQTTEYRTSKQRLVITATSTNTSAVLRLNPYLTEAGTMFDPSTLGNVFVLTAGVPTVTLVGAPRPACGNPAGYQTPCPAAPFTVSSNFGGVSPAHGLDKIRQ